MAYYRLHTYMYLVGHGVLFFSANSSEELSNLDLEYSKKWHDSDKVLVNYFSYEFKNVKKSCFVEAAIGRVL